jgi:O-antigen/teichoic acid export membrane protein
MQETEARPDISLKAAARSGRLILGTQLLRLFVRVGGTITLARLVAPMEFGIFAMAATVHGLVYVFQDFGLSTVTLRKQHLTEEDRSALFWLNLALGSALSVAAGASGVLVASFFHEPALRFILPFMGITFFVNGLHTQLRAQLAREHRFGELNRVEIGAFTASTAIAIVVAFLGGGAWALAAMMVSAEVVLALGIWLAQKWRPAAWPRNFDARSLLGFGASLSVNDGLRYMQRNADQFLVGRWLGAGPLGMYGRAAQFASLPVVYLADPLANLAISTLRHLAPAPAEARVFWMRILNNLAWITMPAAAVFACLATEFISVLLGARWTPSGPVLRGLCAGLALLPLQMACGWMFLAAGTSRRLLASSAVNAGLVIASCFAFRSSGIARIAAGVGIASAAGALASTAFIHVADPVTPGDALAALARPAVGAAALAAAMLAVLHFCVASGAVTRLCAGLVVGCCWIALLWLAWPKARSEWSDHFLLRGQ